MSMRQLHLGVLALSVVACSAPERVVSPEREAMLAKAPPGTEDPTATFSFPVNDPTLDVLSDGQYLTLDLTQSVYANGACGVNAKIFATEAASNSGDATLGMGNPRTKDRTCASYPRTLTVMYPDDVQTTSAVFMNVREIQNTTSLIPVGSTVERILSMSYEGRCDGLRWNPVFGGSLVNVTRVDASTWVVESQPAPNNLAYCTNLNTWFPLDVRFTIKSSYALPTSPLP